MLNGIIVESVNTGISEFDCTEQTNPLKQIQFEQLCTPLLSGYSSSQLHVSHFTKNHDPDQTTDDGEASFPTLIVEQGVLGRYTLAFSVPDYDLYEEATVTVESAVGWVVQDTAIPYPWDIG